jgi:hypothetical protein
MAYSMRLIALPCYQRRHPATGMNSTRSQFVDECAGDLSQIQNRTWRHRCL